MSNIRRIQDYGGGWNPHPTHPTWPPSPWPSPEDCDCRPCPPCPPTPPSCFSAIAKADACWDQSKAMYEFLSKVITDIFKCNPELIPSPPPSAGSGPITGVTDGSNAAAGEVGEYIGAITQISFAAYPQRTQTTVSPLVVQPGDWDLWASLYCSTEFGSVWFNLVPTPAGISNNLAGGNALGITTGVAQAELLAVVIGQSARGNFTVPTLLPFQVTIDQSADAALLAGTAYLQVEGRRRR